MKKYLVNSILITTLLFTPVSAFAQTQQPTQEVKGEILKVEGQRISVQSDDEVTEYIIPSNIQVSRNSLNAQISDLKPGDNVTIQSSNGEILSIGATSESVTDTAQVGLPIILGAIILALIAFTLWKKSTKNFIKTETVKLQ